MVPPWLLALIVLLVVCVIGWYVIYSRHAGVPEGFFDSASRAAATACEKTLSTCLSDGGLIASCTSDYNTCIAKITNPSVSSASNAPTTGTSAASAVTARGSPRSTPVDADYQSLANWALTGNKGTLSDDFIKYIKDIKGKMPGESDIQYVTSKIQDGTLTPEAKTFLEQLKARSSFEYTKPTDASLAAAQGEDASGSVIVPGSLFNDPAVYKAFQKYIKPHETPTPVQAGLTANQKGAEAVQADAILTPSMRQMIRDDVRKAVGEELQAATDEYNNEYEIEYEYQ